MDRHEILGLTPYHRSAGAILNAGAVCGFLFAALGIPYPWIGFFVGSIPAFLILAAHHIKEDAALCLRDDIETRGE